MRLIPLNQESMYITKIAKPQFSGKFVYTMSIYYIIIVTSVIKSILWPTSKSATVALLLETQGSRNDSYFDAFSMEIVFLLANYHLYKLMNFPLSYEVLILLLS
jgi:hypothetical protein